LRDGSHREEAILGADSQTAGWCRSLWTSHAEFGGNQPMTLGRALAYTRLRIDNHPWEERT